MTSLLIALQFLTRLPIRLPGMPEPQAVGRSLLYYPLVGLLLGGVLLLAALALAGLQPWLAAALLLALWTLATGSLHLDGLADSTDAWVGGFGDRERTLAIMKDPRCGPMAVVALVVVLLLKFAALATLLAVDSLQALWLAPLVGRLGLLGLFLCTPYVRQGGLGEALARHLPRTLGCWLLLAWTLGLLLLGGWNNLPALLLAAVVFWRVRRALLARLGGTTGDTAGALLELLETAVLVGTAAAV